MISLPSSGEQKQSELMQTAATLTNGNREERTAVADGKITPARPWLQDFWLWLLLIGPLTAPFFVWLGWGVLKPFADGIYLLGRIVCPKLSEHFMVLGSPMSVCASCWAAVFGLWTVRLLYGRAGEGMGRFSRLGLSALWQRWSAAAVSTRLAVLSIGFMPWAIDAALWDLGLWASPKPFMMLVGYIGGLAAGAFLFPASSAMRARLSAKQAARSTI